LVESGADVTFLVREGRRKILSEQGLQIESPFGDAQLAVKTVAASDLAPIYDAVILTCKAYDLDTAVAAIDHALNPGRIRFYDAKARPVQLNLVSRFGAGEVHSPP
jgi:2-dehydropantoate 2-reductase